MCVSRLSSLLDYCGVSMFVVQPSLLLLHIMRIWHDPYVIGGLNMLVTRYFPSSFVSHEENIYDKEYSIIPLSHVFLKNPLKYKSNTCNICVYSSCFYNVNTPLSFMLLKHVPAHKSSILYGDFVK